MKLSRHGIILSRLEESDIELVRQWRNAEHIRNTMAYRKRITRAQQSKWFVSIDNMLNYYFVIHYEGKPCGVINVKEINRKHRYGEGGIFVHNPALYGTHIPVIASLIVLDFIFLELKYSNKSFIRIMKDNKAAQQFNAQLGYHLVPHQENESNQLYVLTREDYVVRSEKLRRALDLLYPDDKKLCVEGESSPKHLPEVNNYLATK